MKSWNFSSLNILNGDRLTTATQLAAIRTFSLGSYSWRIRVQGKVWNTSSISRARGPMTAWCAKCWRPLTKIPNCDSASWLPVCTLRLSIDQWRYSAGTTRAWGNIIDVEHDRGVIGIEALRVISCLDDLEFRARCRETPYEERNTGRQVADVLSSIVLRPKLIRKAFCDRWLGRIGDWWRIQ